MRWPGGRNGFLMTPTQTEPSNRQLGDPFVFPIEWSSTH